MKVYRLIQHILYLATWIANAAAIPVLLGSTRGGLIRNISHIGAGRFGGTPLLTTWIANAAAITALLGSTKGGLIQNIPHIAAGRFGDTLSNLFFSLPGLGWVGVPPDFDFWKEAKELGKKASDYADKQLINEAVKDKVDEYSITEFKTALQDAVKAVHDLHAYPINSEDFHETFNAEIEKIVERFKEEFSEPLPENKTERYKMREVAVDTALNYIEDAFVKASKLHNVSESEAREKFGPIRTHIRDLVLIMGNLVDNHPLIVDAIIFSVVIAIIPEGLIVRPLLRIFGFGPLGPAKGSAAAWCQRFFFGGQIGRASWFAKLQQAGMKYYPRGLWGLIRRLLGL